MFHFNEVIYDWSMFVMEPLHQFDQQGPKRAVIGGRFL